MAWDIEYTDEFGDWWDSLNADEQDDVDYYVRLLEEKGTTLPFPYCSKIENSKYSHMRELRVQHKGQPYRILYGFDPRRVAILLIGGNKTGRGRWYDEHIPLADKLYDEHIQSLKAEGLL